MKNPIKANTTKFISGLVTLALTCMLITANGQATSPYSRFGLGYVRSQVFSANKAMGDLAAPYNSAININAANPASYAYLTRTTLEIGANFDGVNINTKDSLYKTGNGSLNHIAFAFVPNSKRGNWALSMGLLPFTTINYNFVQNYQDANLGSFRQVYTGKGSLYQAYLGGAYRINGFSIGANLGFLFGKLDYQKTVVIPDSVGAFNTRNLTTMNLKSFVYNVGIQYQKRIYHNDNDAEGRNDIYVTVGAYGSSGANMSAKISNYWERYYFLNNYGYVTSDTPSASFNQKATVKLPFNVSTGIMFGNERFWMLGADFKFMNWASFSSPLNNDHLGNGWRVSIGGQIVPNYEDKKYFNRVQYRLGTYFGKSEINPNGGAVNEIAGTVGFGFPFKSIARLNIAGDFGTRGGSDPNTIRETFYRFTFGLVLNDVWFIKRKFD